MIQGLSIAGDVFWIVALALMASFTLAVWKRLGPDARVPVLWRRDEVLMRAPRAVALLAIPVGASLIGAWLKIESRAPHLDLTGALVVLGVRVTLAPLFALLQVGRLQKALALLDGETR